MFRPYIDYDYELEAAVLGILMIEPASYSGIINILIPESFYKYEHQQLYEAITGVYESGRQIDSLTICRWFYDKKITDIGNTPVAYLISTVINSVVNSAHLESWAYMLRELALKRETIRLTTHGIGDNDAFDSAVEIEKKIKKILDIKATNDWKDGSKVAISLMSRMEANSKKQMSGLTTTLTTLDNMNGGFKPGNLVLIGARPAVGKSCLMGRMILRIAHGGHRVGVISLEMNNEDIMARMAAFESDVPFYQIDRGKFYEADQHRRVLETISTLATLPIEYSDTAKVDMRDIRAKAEKLMKHRPLEILFIDYLQLIEPDSQKGKNREQEVAQISRGCKLLAKTLNIPVVLLVQLNREAADGKPPELKHLRESGQLEADADIVLLLDRNIDEQDPVLKRQASLYVRKWRNGSPTKIDLDFEGETMKFTEVELNKFKPVPPRSITEPKKWNDDPIF